MRFLPMVLVALQLPLTACQTAPASYAPLPPPRPNRQDVPAMRCVTDFWGNCTRVAGHRHAYRWRYVRPGARSRERPEIQPEIRPRQEPTVRFREQPGARFREQYEPSV